MKYRNLYILFLIFTASVLFYFVSPKAAEDEDITISTNTTWAAGTYTYRDITITNNATLTLGGSYTNDVDGSGVIINARNITINSGSVISANATGYAGSHGPGMGIGSFGSGAGYGGAGSVGGTGETPGGTYGSAVAPIDLGSGGGNAGGAGGGAIKLNLSGNLLLDGMISANGANGAMWKGGGSGGSVYIIGNDFSGAGSITATGGNGASGSGSGGGGRVAIYYGGTNGLNLANITANGGTGGTGPGEIGSRFIFDRTNKDLSVTSNMTLDRNIGIDANGDPSSDGVFRFRNLTVTNNASLIAGSSYTTDTDGAGIEFILSGNLTIDTGAKIDAKGKGYAYEAGEGKGTKVIANYGGGAGHGGDGGKGESGAGGSKYDVTLFPVKLGSGGATARGGAGGGIIKISAADIEINGSLDASAGVATANGATNGSGGAGGTIYLICASLTGSGTILANGGNGTGYSGGGGGGRIAIYGNTSEFNADNITAAKGLKGGSGTSVDGGVGTVFLYNTVSGDVTASSDVTFYANQGINRDGTVRDDGVFYFNNLTVTNNATVTIGGHYTNDSDGRGVTINLNGNLTIESGSSIVTDGQGYSGASGPGKGNGGSAQSASGGSYGGLGGPSYNPVLASPTYGSDQENHPYLLGSGGGNGDSGAGGSGGGAITLRVLGNIINNGTVSANGSSGTGGISGWRPGGGSGGSIFIVCDSISGDGSIIASGGAGLGDANFGSGGGGGGRISIVYSTAQSMPTENITAPGGAGGGAVVARNGSSGTVNITQRTLPAADFSLKNPNNNSTQYTNTTDVEIVPADGDVDRYKDAASASELPPTFYAPGWNNVDDGKSLEAGEGTKTVRAWLKDQNELIASSVGESTIILDQTEPTISVTGPGSTSSETTIVSGTVSDNLSGINSLTIQVVTLNSPIIFFNPQGQEITVNQDGSFSATVALSVGDNQISLVTTDGAGNSTTENLTVAREGSSSVGETDEDIDQTGTGNIAQENIDSDDDSSQNSAAGGSTENETESLPENEKNLTEKIEDNVKTIGGCLLGNCPSKVRTATIYSFFGGISISILVYLLVARSKRRKKK